MTVTDRMLTGAIASNPASYETGGEYRYCRSCDELYFTSSKEPNSRHDGHDSFALPALNPDGRGRMEKAFRAFIKRWPEERQLELDSFAQKKGWDLAWELRYGGGALDDRESAEWQVIVNNELRRLVKQVRAQLNGGGG